MASRVNVKFVILLSAALIAVSVGAAGLFFFVKFRSGDRLVRLGEQAMAKGDIKAADFHYSKAVAKDPTNVEWLSRWREIREKKIPETQTVYEQEYSFYVYGILRQLAKIQRTNVEAHREYLQAVYEQRVLGSGREGWQHLISETEENLKFFDPEQPPALRRFRGLSLARLAMMDLPRERIELAKADLRAALEADPGDALAAYELASLHRSLAEQAIAENRQEIAKEENQAARQVMQQALAKLPQDPTLKIGLLWLDAAEASQATSGRTSGEQHQQRAAALATLRPRIGQLAEELEAGGQKLDASVLGRYFYVALVIDPANALQLSADLVDQAIAAAPEDADLLLLRAQIHTMKGEFELAGGIFQKIIELPTKAISLDGIKLFSFRRFAYIGKVDAALSQALRATEPAQRDAAIARAKRERETLIRNIPEESPELAFLDGKLLFIERDYRGAQRKLDPLIKAEVLTGIRAAEAMAIMADIGLKVDPPQPGLTRQYLSRALKLQPGSEELRLDLARVEVILENKSVAMDHLRYVLDRNPTHEQAREMMNLLLASLNQGGQVSDPVLGTLIEVDNILAGDRRQIGDEAAAIRMLEERLARHNHDPRLIVRLAGLKFARGDRDGALATLQLGREKHPDNSALQTYADQLRATASVEGAIAMIDGDTASPAVDKAIMKYRVYLGFNKPTEAQAALEQAARLAPDDPRVLEFQFISALEKKDLTEANRLAQRAIALDADRAEGDTFAARLLIAQGNHREAALRLQRAVERGNPNSAIYRLLGNLYLELGRGPEAITAFKRGLELNPSDPVLLKVTLAAMVRLGNIQDAIAAARNSESVVRRDPDLRNMWLGLEAAAGNTDFARSMREQIRSRFPEDRLNAASLAEIYIGDRAWDRARQLIESLRKEQDSLNLVDLDARWHAARGDWNRGRQVYIEYITGINQTAPELLTTQHFVSMAQFLMQHNQTELAIEALNNALPMQDPRTMTVDLAVADLFMGMGRFAEAEERYRRVLQGGVQDPDLRIRKRLLESLVQQRKTAEIDREIAAIGDKLEGDPELMCLQAEHLRSRGDARGAQQVLDRTVARFPQEPLPYYRRARILLLTPQLAQDAMADLAQAIRVRPGFWPALKMRANVHLAQGRGGDAVSDLKTAVEHNPGRDDLLLDLVRLLLQLDRESEAVEVASAAAKLRSRDARLLLSLGEAFAESKRWSQAAGYYKQVWEQQRTEVDAIRYIGALLEQSPSRLEEAEAVLSAADLDLSKSRNLLMTRATIRKKQKRLDAARADAINALRLAERPDLILGWSEHVRAIFPEPGAALAIMNAVQPTPPVEPWLNLAKAAALVADKDKRSDGLASLRALITGDGPAEARITAARLLSSILAEDKQWQDATEVTRMGLELAAEDVMFNNNMAYFLAEYLNQAGDAVPYAERAAKAAPANGAVLETLATAYWAAGKKGQGLEALENALRTAMADVERAKMTIRLADWRLESGDRPGALRALEMVREYLIDVPSLAEQQVVKEPLEALRRKLGAS